MPSRRAAIALLYGPHLVLAGAYLAPVGSAWWTRVPGPFLGIDAILQCGILEWTGRQWWRPERWVDLPIFHPAENALAFMDSLLGQALLVWPLRFLPRANDVLLYNVAWLAALAAGVLACGVLWWATRPAAVAASGKEAGGPAPGWHAAAGAAVATLAVLGSPYTASQLGHLNQLPPFGPPLVLTGLIVAAGWGRWGEGARSAEAAGARPAGLWLAAAALAAQAAWGWYGFGEAATAAAVAVVAVAAETARRPERGRQAARWFRTAAAPALLVAAATAVLAWPYLAASRHYAGFERTTAEVRSFSADIGDLINPGAYRWGWADLAGRELSAAERAEHRRRQVVHPGWIPLGLAAVGLLARRRIPRRSRRVGYLLLAVGATGLVFAFGDSVGLPGTERRLPLPLGVLQDLLPPLRSLRAVTRFAYLSTLAVAWWAGVGAMAVLARAERRRAGRARSVVVTATVLGALLAEAWPVGLTAVEPYRPARLARATATDDPLAAAAPGAVLTLPAPADEQQEDATEARWLLRALSHGHPVTGGVSGWVPPSTRALRRELERVLSGEMEVVAVVETVSGLGVRHVELAMGAAAPEEVEEAARWRERLAEAGVAWRPSVPGYLYGRWPGATPSPE